MGTAAPAALSAAMRLFQIRLIPGCRSFRQARLPHRRASRPALLTCSVASWRIGADSRQASPPLLARGPAGGGRGPFVDDLLALLFCTDARAADRPCNACRGCRDARARAHPDLVLGSPARGGGGP